MVILLVPRSQPLAVAVFQRPLSEPVAFRTIETELAMRSAHGDTMVVPDATADRASWDSISGRFLGIPVFHWEKLTPPPDHADYFDYPRETGVCFGDAIFYNAHSKERPMGSKRSARREFLKGSAALVGGLLGAAAPAIGQTPASPPMIKGDKDVIAYGVRSRFVNSVRIAHGGRPSPDDFGLVFHIASPLQDSVGVITPSSLHFVGTTRGSYIPEIDPKEHRLLIHGMVDRPLTFTMEDLKRFPSVTRLHFMECAGNRTSPRAKTVQESHGMTSTAEWTGVLLSVLFKECGVKAGASWFVAERSEEVKGASSIPMAKGMEDCFVAYGMNGEPLRPQQGFPLRLMVPGFEGIFHTKYLRRIKVVDRYYMNYNEFGHLQQDLKTAALGYQIGPKSVITFPSGGHQLPGKGFYEISGLAWSGGGAIKKVEVSTDGGRRWN